MLIELKIKFKNILHVVDKPVHILLYHDIGISFE